MSGRCPEGGERHPRFMRIKVLGDVTVDERPGHGRTQRSDPPWNSGDPRFPRLVAAAPVLRGHPAPPPTDARTACPPCACESMAARTGRRNGGGVHTAAVSYCPGRTKAIAQLTRS